ncbi:hypothetical protein DPMN_112463 [Dreissena polymorpha]|uniref:Uncharacterized protein n=1 Tax=Dreissena polymorpha TaxID=45954 RepID=A0A9D4QQN6_DREPO|nr:hypothetical protein DPMN_112463 [Dreissena polymorpha]
MTYRLSLTTDFIINRSSIYKQLLRLGVAGDQSEPDFHESSRDTRRCGQSVTPVQSELARKRGPLKLFERPVVRARPGTPFTAKSMDRASEEIIKGKVTGKGITGGQN